MGHQHGDPDSKNVTASLFPALDEAMDSRTPRTVEITADQTEILRLTSTELKNPGSFNTRA